jgi:hypothetical protein
LPEGWEPGDVASSRGASAGLEGLEGVVSVVQAVTDEIARMPAELGESALASLALACAENIDAARPGSTPGAMWAQRLQDVLKELRGLAPPPKSNDGIDRLRNRHTARRAAATNRGRS